MASQPCHWTKDENVNWDANVWATDCGHEFDITDGDPEENGFRFCIYCGKGLEATLIPYKDDDEG